MSELRATPGPWHVTPMNGSVYYGMFQISPWAERQRSMLRGESPDSGSAYELWANAYLIAAAPELYAALSQVVATSPIDDSVLPEVLAILAKARGE